MASTPEGKAKARIKKRMEEVLQQRGLKAKVVWNAGADFGVATLDMVGVIAGHPVAIEAKRFDKKGKLTARQKLDLLEFHEAGAMSMVIENELDLEVFIAWLRALEPRAPFSPAVIEALQTR